MTLKLKDGVMTAAGMHYVAYRLSELGYTLGIMDSNMFVDMLAMNTEDDSNPVAVKVVTVCGARHRQGTRVWPLTAAGIVWARKSLAGGVIAEHDLYIAFVDLKPDKGQAEAFVMAAEAAMAGLGGGASEFRLRADAAQICREAWEAMFNREDRL